MAHGLSLQLAAIQPFGPRPVGQGPRAKATRRAAVARVPGTYWTKRHTRLCRFLKAASR